MEYLQLLIPIRCAQIQSNRKGYYWMSILKRYKKCLFESTKNEGFYNSGYQLFIGWIDQFPCNSTIGEFGLWNQ